MRGISDTIVHGTEVLLVFGVVTKTLEYLPFLFSSFACPSTFHSPGMCIEPVKFYLDYSSRNLVICGDWAKKNEGIMGVTTIPSLPES